MVADDECICTRVDGSFRVLSIHDAFENQLAIPARFDPRHIVPSQAGIKLVVDPSGISCQVHFLIGMANDISEMPPGSLQHIPPPAKLGAQICDGAKVETGWNTQAVFDVDVSLANHLQIQRQYQR